MAPLFVWDNRYAINVGEIDEQHQALFSLTNAVHDALREGAHRDQIGRIILELVAYIHTHFSYEEALMIRSGYPDFAVHQVTHLRFTQRVNEFDMKFRQGKLQLTAEMMLFLNDWLMQHILGDDRKYAPHVRKYLSTV